MKLFIHSQTSTVFGNGYVILSHTLLGMWLPIQAGIKVAHVFKKGPRSNVSKTSHKPLVIYLVFTHYASHHFEET